MRIGVVGINHKMADLPLREMLSRACQKRFSPENSTHGPHAFVLLSTCNRMELYFSSEDLAETHSYILHVLKSEIKLETEVEFDQKLYSYFGEECFSHLAEVTSGLDSAIVAETEIQGQVKGSYEMAVKFSTLPSPLHYLFQKSLKIAKEIRSKIDLGRGLEGLEHAIFQRGQALLERPLSAKILIVGASLINQKVLGYLKRKGCTDLTLCNRSEEKALLLAKEHQIETLPWESLSTWREFDWIILGTKAPRYLLKADAAVEKSRTLKLVMDLSFPRNADPRLTQDSNLRLLNIDQLNRLLRFRRQLLNSQVELAKRHIGTLVGRHTHLFQEKSQRGAREEGESRESRRMMVVGG